MDRSESHFEEVKYLNVLNLNKDKNLTYQKLQDIVNVVLKGEFIPLSAYFGKEERSNINNLNLHFRTSEGRAI